MIYIYLYDIYIIFLRTTKLSLQNIRLSDNERCHARREMREHRRQTIHSC